MGGPLALSVENPPTIAMYRSDLPGQLRTVRCLAGDDVEVTYTTIPIDLTVSIVHSDCGCTSPYTITTCTDPTLEVLTGLLLDEEDRVLLLRRGIRYSGSSECG